MTASAWSRRWAVALAGGALLASACSAGSSGRVAAPPGSPAPDRSGAPPPATPVTVPIRTGMTVVSLTFDNASSDQYATRPILAAHGMKATFFVSSGVVGRNPSLMNWGQLRSLAGDGHEIGGKTLDHVDLTSVPDAEARRQVCDDRQNLMGRGFPVTDFAYPNTAVNPSVAAIVRSCGYRSGRAAGGIGCPGCPEAETIPPADAYRTSTAKPVGQTTTLVDMEQWITAAEEHGGGWVQLVFFDVCDGCGPNAVREADLVALLDWLRPRAARGTVVATVEQALAAGGPIGHRPSTESP